MKRSLRIVGEPVDRSPASAVLVTLGSQVISVVDPHDGGEARRFARLLVDSGGVLLADAVSAPAPDLSIVVRSTPESAEARLRAEVLEEGADLVLGSARPVVAALLAERAVPGAR